MNLNVKISIYKNTFIVKSNCRALTRLLVFSRSYYYLSFAICSYRRFSCYHTYPIVMNINYNYLVWQDYIQALELGIFLIWGFIDYLFFFILRRPVLIIVKSTHYYWRIDVTIDK